MTTTALNTVRDAWDSLLGRILIIGLSAGWVPFYFLTRVHASLTE